MTGEQIQLLRDILVYLRACADEQHYESPDDAQQLANDLSTLIVALDAPYNRDPPAIVWRATFMPNYRFTVLGQEQGKHIVASPFVHRLDAVDAATHWAEKGLKTSVLGDGPYYVGIHNLPSGALL